MDVGSFVERMARIAIEGNASRQSGAFYGGAEKLSPGVGVVYADVPYSYFDEHEQDFIIQDGPALILTHECDIDQANSRSFNDRAIICPVITLDTYLASAVDIYKQAAAESIIRDAAADKISRLFLLPRPLMHIPIPEIAFGGLLYLNMMTNVHVDQLKLPARPICALSQYALQRLDAKMQNHLFRPKSETLAELR